MNEEVTSVSASQEYTRFLLKLHDLDPRGDVESPELDAICDAMERPWQHMTGPERERMKGLSQDLYALADVRHGKPMSSEERQRWTQDGKTALASRDPDLQLAHLRREFPSDVSARMIAFLQGRCWERLGHLEVALVFMAEAAKSIRGALLQVLDYVHQLGRYSESTRLAEQIIDDPTSSAFDLYVASSFLCEIAGRQDSQASRRHYLQRIIAPLRRALTAERSSLVGLQQIPPLEPGIALALAYAVQQLGDNREAAAVCTDTLARYPTDVALRMIRGAAILRVNEVAAERDFEELVNADAPFISAYLTLAWFRVREERFHDVLLLCNRALWFRDVPGAAKAALYEWHGIASAVLGQSLEWVTDDFKKAVEHDPTSADRIEQNRRTAVQLLNGKTISGSRPAPAWAIIGAERLLKISPEFAPSHPIPDIIRARIRSTDLADLMTAAAA